MSDITLHYYNYCMYFNRVFGHPRDSRSSWIITHINFTSIFHHSCEESDYYYWTVSDGVSYYIILHIVLVDIAILTYFQNIFISFNLIILAK